MSKFNIFVTFGKSKTLCYVVFFRDFSGESQLGSMPDKRFFSHRELGKQN